jgi:hypothetical protein
MEPSPISRRSFIQGAAAATAGAALVSTLNPGRASAAAGGAAQLSASDGVPLHWLEGVPATTTGAAWGVPWPRGQVKANTPFTLATSRGEAVPVQSWPLAYWPDGSLKWSGHAIGADAGLDSPLTLRAGTPATPASAVTATRRGGDIVLDNGTITVTVATGGDVVLRAIARGTATTASNGQLVLHLQDKPDEETGPARHTALTGIVDDATLEQSGPVRAVVRLSGHYAENGKGQGPIGPYGGTKFPWTMRVYLTAGTESVKLVHSFIWNGDPKSDFIRGLGLQVQVPLTDELWDRYIRFTGSGDGVWGEPVLVLTGLRRDPGTAVDDAQVAGTATPPPSTWQTTVQQEWNTLPQWGDFSLVQNDASSFTIWKRTSPASSWIKHAGFGDRSTGFGYVGGVSGGLGFGVRNFWQQFPRALDIRDASTTTATVTLWSWSPHAAAMDMRPYDTGGHGLDLAYEDSRYGFGISNGIGQSTEMQLWAFGATPSRDRIAQLGAALALPPQLVTDPATYASAGIFGYWGLPDRSTPARARLEDSIDAVVSFYTQQADERRWYGFWHYGNVMHTYDQYRHSWRYDVGGYAWDNAELGTDAMLWYQFLRTGRAETFRLASNMTRHVSDVDTYHTGPFAGLGSRHDVQEFGDGAKEVRVSEAYTKRFMYYLTADELLGDRMRDALQADQTLLKYPPLRDYLTPPAGVPTVIRIGPDWFALVSNWMTEWERTRDTRYRDRITTGMADIGNLPAGLFTGEEGGAVGFDPKTAHITNLNLGGDYRGGYNLMMAFCGDQIIWEAIGLVDTPPAFYEKLYEFARYVQAPAPEQTAFYGFSFNPQVFGVIYSRVTAWAGQQRSDATIMARGWQKFTSDPSGTPWPAPVEVGGPDVVSPVHEIPVAQIADGTLATNDAAQRGLAIIELLAIAPGQGP